MTQDNAHIFQLEHFFPYLVRRYYHAVSQSVMTIYGREYNLTASEWRTLAVLGYEQPLSAGEIVERSNIDKVKVSRAISGLTKIGYMERRVDEQDRRKVALHLTEAGQAVFEDLAQKVQSLEDNLLAGFDEQERVLLESFMQRVRDNAAQLEKDFNNSQADQE